MPEKEYIEREAVVERINDSIRSWSRDCNSNAPRMVSAYKDVLFRIQSVPTADVAEVVRCKDCKHWETDKDYSQKPWCTFWTLDSTLFHTHPDDFCSYGERKKDNAK